MLDFFDVNYWVTRARDIDNIKFNKIISSLGSNNINHAIISNKTSLNYDWDLGNNELISNSLLMDAGNIYFAFVLVPDAWFSRDFRKYLGFCLKNKVRIFRLYPKLNLFYLNDFYMKRIFNVLSEYKVPIMLDLKQLDITGNKYFDLKTLAEILKGNEDMPLILECSLKQLMFSRFFYPLLEEYRNLNMEISNLLLMEQIEEFVKKFGSERLIFGTNYPAMELELSTNRVILSKVSNDIKKNIAFNNIYKLINSINI